LAKAQKKKSKKKKRYIGRIILRLLILAATAVGILAVGYYYYEWRPLGPKIGADQVGKEESTPPAQTPLVANDLGSVIKDAINSDQPETEASPSPTTTPTPETITQEDQNALSNFLKKEIK